MANYFNKGVTIAVLYYYTITFQILSKITKIVKILEGGRKNYLKFNQI